VVAVLVTITTNKQKEIVNSLKSNPQGKLLVYSLLGFSVIIFMIVLFNIVPLSIQFFGIAIMMFSTSIVSTYFINYNPEAQTTGLTVWSVSKAKEYFKGGKVNEAEGETINVNWKLKDGEDDIVNFSIKDMELMKANVGDLVYLCDSRKYLGGLKSIHSVYGEPHEENGVVYINNEALLNGVFEKGRNLTAEKEM